ncbi:ABC transporter permease [Labilithrix luteola]|nr:MlaE family lipid ABC transporter permease subunit [Labilithrix luteola]
MRWRRAHKQRGEPAFRFEREGEGLIRLAGELRLEDAAELWRLLHEATNGLKAGKVIVDVDGVTKADGGSMALLVELRAELAARGVDMDVTGASKVVEPIVSLYMCDEAPCPLYRHETESTVAQIGRATIHVGHEAKEIVGFFGEMVLAAVRLVRAPRSGHWRDVIRLIERSGADAVPIVLLINFLIGFVMAFQSARELKLFGANLYVADLVGIAHTRELAPLMTAIIVCGRSGAAFAAEIGSMKVSEEIDALRTLGLGPFGWLVVPRVIALMAVVPVLTLLGDFMGILGGMLVAVSDLDLSVRGYLHETTLSVEPMDVGTGLLKSAIFALAIALIACQQGFAATGGAEGVGRRTTATVVASLFALVLIDALVTVAFRVVGI